MAHLRIILYKGYNGQIWKEFEGRIDCIFLRSHLNTKSYIMEATTTILMIGIKVPLSMVGFVAMTLIVPGLMNG